MLPLATDLPKITQMLRLALHSTGSRFLDRQRQNKKADVSRRELRPGKVVKRAQGEEEEPGQQKKRGLASARLQQHPRQQSSEASSAWGSSPNQRPATNTSRVCAAPNGFTLLAKIPSAVRLMADGVSRATLPFPVPVCLNSDSEDSSRLLGVLWRCSLRSTYRNSYLSVPAQVEDVHAASWTALHLRLRVVALRRFTQCCRWRLHWLCE